MEKFKLANNGMYIGDSLESSDRYIKWTIDEDKQVLDIVSTYVDKQYGGQGLGSELVYAADDYARENNYQVKGTCPFAHTVIERSDKHRDLLIQ